MAKNIANPIMDALAKFLIGVAATMAVAVIAGTVGCIVEKNQNLKQKAK
jgi:hypothetical protein